MSIDISRLWREGTLDLSREFLFAPAEQYIYRKMCCKWLHSSGVLCKRTGLPFFPFHSSGVRGPLTCQESSSLLQRSNISIEKCAASDRTPAECYVNEPAFHSSTLPPLPLFPLPFFHSSTLPPFHSSTLPIFQSSNLPLFHPQTKSVTNPKTQRLNDYQFSVRAIDAPFSNKLTDNRQPTTDNH